MGSHDQLALAEESHAAWRSAVENVGSERTAEAELYAHLKQLMKLYIRQRDKVKMLEMINEPNTIRLLRNLLEIFYEPIMRVIKAANVYNSVSDLSSFVDDIVKTVEEAQRQGFSADPNQTVQAFIDLCARHENDFYKFVHEMHKHDNGLFDALMGHIEDILDFLRKGPQGGAPASAQMPGFTKISPGDFGVEEEDLSDLDDDYDSFDSEEEDDEADVDGITAEQKMRARQARLRAGAGEPQKPDVAELDKLMDGFLMRLRLVLSDVD